MSKPRPAVLVTGAAARIGKAIALDMANAGWAVAVHYNRSAEPAEKVVAEICAKPGGKALALQADLGVEAQTQSLIGQATAELGPLTCLINSASAFENDSIETMSRESWDLHVETNLRAPLVLAQTFAAQLPQGQSGNIINLLDQRVWKLTPQFLSYTLSKTALWTLTQTLAQALAPSIRVNGIGPGPTIRNKRQSKEDFQRQIDATPLKRGATLEEIAQAVQFILKAQSLTGQMIALDGGQHLIWQTPDVRGLTE